MTTYSRRFDERVSKRPFGPWHTLTLDKTKNPGCFVSCRERIVTVTWKTQEITVVSEPCCLNGGRVEGDRCVGQRWQYTRDRNGWPTSQGELVTFTYPAGTCPREIAGPVIEHTDTYVESECRRTCVVYPVDEAVDRVWLDSARVFHGNRLVAPEGSVLADVAVDGRAWEVQHEGYAVDDFEPGRYEADFTVAVDGAEVALHLPIEVVARVSFDVRDPAAFIRDVDEEGRVVFTVSLANQTTDRQWVWLDVTPEQAGWTAFVVGDPCLALEPLETLNVGIEAIVEPLRPLRQLQPPSTLAPFTLQARVDLTARDAATAVLYARTQSSGDERQEP